MYIYQGTSISNLNPHCGWHNLVNLAHAVFMSYTPGIFLTLTEYTFFLPTTRIAGNVNLESYALYN